MIRTLAFMVLSCCTGFSLFAQNADRESLGEKEQRQLSLFLNGDGKSALADTRKLLETWQKQGFDLSFALGEICKKGDELYDKGDYRPAIPYYQLGSDFGDPTCEVDLGYMYNNGKGVFLDHSQAQKYFEKAAAQNSSDGLYNLADMIDNHHATDNYTMKDAVGFYQRAVEKGPDGMGGRRSSARLKELGIDAGEGPLSTAIKIRDITTAKRPLDVPLNDDTKHLGDAEEQQLFLLLNKNDLDGARTLLGSWQKQGFDISGALGAICGKGDEFYDREDYPPAIPFYQLGSYFDDPRCEVDLGYMYYNDKGVSLDFSQAQKYFEKAAAHNYSDGLYNLADMIDKHHATSNYSMTDAIGFYQKAVATGPDGMGGKRSSARLQELEIDSGEAPLVSAVKIGDISAAKRLLDEPPLVGGGERDSLLLIAIEKGEAEIVDLLIARGANPNARDKDGSSALLLAIVAGRKDLVQMLLRSHAEVNTADSSGDTPLTVALAKRHPDLAELLIEAGADLNMKGRNGATALHWAIPGSRAPEYVSILHTILDKGANLEAKEEHGLTPLMLASDSEELSQTFRLLVERGSNVNVRDNYGDTPLMLNSLAGFDKNVSLLLAKGAHVDDANEQGKTALMYASEKDKVRVVRLLLAAGASPERPDRAGTTAMMLAAASKDPALIKEFTIQDPSGLRTRLLKAGERTLDLIDAALNGDLQRVKELIAAGADVNGVGPDGMTALDAAILKDKQQIVAQLLKSKPRLNEEAANRPTPLMAAMLIGDSTIVHMLIQAGADVNAKTRDGVTPLLGAILSPTRAQARDAIDALISAGADVNAQSNAGLSAVKVVCAASDWALVRRLERAHAVGEEGWCSLLAASAIGTPAEITVVIQSGVSPNSQHPETKETAIHIATKNKRANNVSALVEARADLEAKDSFGASALIRAVEQGNADIVQALLRGGADVKKHLTFVTPPFGNYDNVTALHVAAEEYDAQVVKYLLDAGADVNAIDGDGRTPLMLASYQPVFAVIMEKKPDLSIKDQQGRTALMHALEQTNFSANRDLTPVRELIDHGSNVNARDEAGNSPIVVALSNPSTGVAEMVRLLLAAGADINGEQGTQSISIAEEKNQTTALASILARNPRLDHDGWSNVMATAVSQGDIHLLDLALSSGADVQSLDREGRTMLIRASPRSVEIIQRLIRAGVPVNAKDSDGQTALMRFAESGCEVCLKALLDAKADRNAQDNEGDTALTLAALENFDLPALRTLLTSGVDIALRNKKGDDAILVAAGSGADKNISALLKAGASSESRDREGRTPIIRAAVARSGGYPAPSADSVKVLIRAKADINASDAEGDTALITAARKGYPDIVRLLLNAGADIKRSNRSGDNALLAVLDARDEEIESLDPIPRLTPQAQEEIATALIEHGSDVNLTTTDGVTPLMRVSFRGNLALVGLLLKHGARVNAKNDIGRTALMLAAGQGNVQVVEALIKAGADINLKDQSGLDAVSLAKLADHEDIVDVLKRVR